MVTTTQWRATTLLAAVLPLAEAHLTTVCTATAPSEPGVMHFLFGSYHPTVLVKGAVHIKPPDGEETSFPMSADSWCGMPEDFNEYDPDDPEKPGGDAKAMYKKMIDEGMDCAGALRYDSVVTCFDSFKSEATGTVDDPYPAKAVGPGAACPQDNERKGWNDGLCHAFPQMHRSADGVSSGKSYDLQQVIVVASVTAPSGIFIVRTTGTDNDYAPCGHSNVYVDGIHPCKMKSNKYFQFELTVAGYGVPCGGEVPRSENTVSSSYDGCWGQWDGFVCPVECDTTVACTKTGILMCNQGVWENSVSCNGCEVPPSPPALPPAPPTSPTPVEIRKVAGMRNVVMTIPNQYGYWDNRGNLLAVSHDGAKIYAGGCRMDYNRKIPYFVIWDYGVDPHYQNAIRVELPIEPEFCGSMRYCVQTLDLSPDGTKLLVLTLQSRIARIYDAFTGALLLEHAIDSFEEHPEPGNCHSNARVGSWYGKWSPDGTHVAIAGKDNNIHVLTAALETAFTISDAFVSADADGRSDYFCKNQGTDRESCLRTVKWSPDGTKLLATGGYGFGMLKIFSVEDQSMLYASPDPVCIYDVDFNPVDSNQFVEVCSQEVKLVHWNQETNEMTTIATEYAHSYSTIAMFTADGSKLITMGMDRPSGSLALFQVNPNSLTRVADLSGGGEGGREHQDGNWAGYWPLIHGAISPDGRRFASIMATECYGSQGDVNVATYEENDPTRQGCALSEKGETVRVWQWYPFEYGALPDGVITQEVVFFTLAIPEGRRMRRLDDSNALDSIKLAALNHLPSSASLTINDIQVTQSGDYYTFEVPSQPTTKWMRPKLGAPTDEEHEDGGLVG